MKLFVEEKKRISNLLDNVGMIRKLLKQRDFSNGGRGDAVFFGFQSNLLQSDDFVLVGG